MAVNFNNKEEANKAIHDAIVALNSPYTLQADAVLVQVAPEQNTWYTVLDTKANARIYSIVPIVWDTDETLEVRITTKKRTFIGSIAATKTTYYWAFLKMYGDGLDFSSVAHQLAGYQAPLEDPSIKIEIRKTTAAGAGTLECRIVWAQKESS